MNHTEIFIEKKNINVHSLELLPLKMILHHFKGEIPKYKGLTVPNLLDYPRSSCGF